LRDQGGSAEPVPPEVPVGRGSYDRRVRIVVNHLRFEQPLPGDLIASAEDACRRLVDAGGLAASLVRVNERHAILILTFPDLETEERIKSEIGGPWMKEHVLPLLASPTERSSGEVVAGAGWTR
jgi:hypothetical protein